MSLDLPVVAVEEDRIVSATFFDLVSGELRGTMSARLSVVREAVPPNCGFVDGVWSADSHKVNAATKVVEPLAQEDRDARAAARLLSDRKDGARRAILQIEQGQQRAARDRELGTMTLLEYRQRLQSIEDEIAALRAIISS